jgi:diamine N-acetyltransferase
MMTITLRPITRANWRECIRLTVTHEQSKFIVPNVQSLAQAYAEPERTPMAIYADEEMVGFTLFNEAPLPDGSYRISRFMIGNHYQRQGYARAALRLIIEQMRQNPDCREILVEYHRHNHAAAHLFTAFGFTPIETTPNEILARLTF